MTTAALRERFSQLARVVRLLHDGFCRGQEGRPFWRQSHAATVTLEQLEAELSSACPAVAKAA